MLSRRVHPWITVMPTVVTFSGSTRLVRPVHLANTFSPKLVNWLPSSKVMLVRLLHPKKTLSPISLTVAGILMETRPQFINSPVGSALILLLESNVTSVSDEQLENALSPRVFTGGSSSFLIPEQK